MTRSREMSPMSPIINFDFSLQTTCPFTNATFWSKLHCNWTYGSTDLGNSLMFLNNVKHRSFSTFLACNLQSLLAAFASNPLIISHNFYCLYIYIVFSCFFVLFILTNFCFYRMLDQILSTRIMVKKALKDHKNDKVSWTTQDFKYFDGRQVQDLPWVHFGLWLRRLFFSFIHWCLWCIIQIWWIKDGLRRLTSWAIQERSENLPVPSMIWLLCFSLLFLFLFAFLFDFHLGAVVYMKWRLTNALYVCMYVCM